MRIIELPGVIDAHVHFREPGITHKEDFESGSKAAANGGITFFCDMPNVIPPTSTVKLFKEKHNFAESKSCIDFGLFALLTNENTEEIPAMAEAGAVGFKVFLGTSTGNLASPSKEVLIEQLRLCTKLGKRTGFHAETSQINMRCTDECKKREAEKGSLPLGMLLNDARPVESEVKAIELALDYAKKANAKIHIHHVTCKQGIELISKAKKEGMDVTAETCPHYLFFNAETCSHKVYPPIRPEEHRLALWEAVKSGIIDMIATDHAPHTAKEKSLPLWDAPAGLTGVETFVSLMLNEVNKGAITIDDFVRLCCLNPAKIWGINNDGNYTIIDMDKKVKIEKEKMISKSKTTPYDGWELTGAPISIIINGKKIDI